MQDLRDEMMYSTGPLDFIEQAWETSLKNAAAIHYISGVLDTLRFTRMLTAKEYNLLYEKYVYRTR